MQPNYQLIDIDDMWTPPGVHRDAPIESSECSFMDKFASLLRKHGHTQIKFIAKEMGIPNTMLLTTVVALTGQRPSDWMDQFVMADAGWLLTNTLMEVKEVAKLCGYPSGSTFSRPFMRIMGISPLEYRKANQRVHIETVIEVVGEGNLHTNTYN